MDIFAYSTFFKNTKVTKRAETSLEVSALICSVLKKISDSSN